MAIISEKQWKNTKYVLGGKCFCGFNGCCRQAKTSNTESKELKKLM